MKATARMLASREAAFDSENVWMFWSSRLNACASRTADRFSCRLALTSPTRLRTWRNALRAWPENHDVATNMTGVTASATSASTKLSRSML